MSHFGMRGGAVRRSIPLLMGAVCLGGGAAARAGTTYTVLDLGTLGGSSSFPGVAGTVNASGQVVGGSMTSGSGFNTAFRTSPTSSIKPGDNLDSPGVITTGAQAINDIGQTVGTASFAVGSSTQHAFRTTPNGQVNAAADLGTLDASGSAALGINASGQVVGNSGVYAFRTTPGGVITPATDLGGFGGPSSFAYSLNDSGQAVGSSYLPSGIVYHAFVTAPNGVITAASDLGTFSGTGNSEAHGINAAGQIVGWSNEADNIGNAHAHAFRTTPGGLITDAEDLGTLGGIGPFSQAWGINSLGQTVGWSSLTTEGTLRHAFFVDVTGGMQDLNNLIPANSDIVLLAAFGINDAGQIAGYGSVGGQDHAFLLTPSPEPSSLGLLALTGASMLKRRRK